MPLCSSPAAWQVNLHSVYYSPWYILLNSRAQFETRSYCLNGFTTEQKPLSCGMEQQLKLNYYCEKVTETHPLKYEDKQNEAMLVYASLWSGFHISYTTLHAILYPTHPFIPTVQPERRSLFVALSAQNNGKNCRLVVLVNVLMWRRLDNRVFLEEKIFRFVTALDLIKCLIQIK